MALSFGDLLSELQPASWRGIEFHVPNARDATGRRVQAFLFPGLDFRVHQDFGALDGPVTVYGLVVGDDYVERAQLLRAAFREPGPGTLVHPWYGELTLILTGQPEIELDWRRLRLAAFSATFDYWREAPAAAIDTLGALRLAIGGLKSAIRNLLTKVLAPVRLAFGVVNAVAGFGLWLGGSVTNLVGGLTNGGALLGLLAPNLAALSSLGSARADGGYAATVADALEAPAATIAGAAEPEPPPAIAPGGDAGPAASVQLDPAQVAAALLAAAEWEPQPSIALPAGVLLAAQAYALAGALQAGARIPFGSQQDALAWRGVADAAIAGRMAATVAAAGDAPAEAATVYQALADLRVALARDMTAEIGRLPAVRRITIPGDCTLWQVANHLAADNVALIRPLYEDLLSRNRIRRPGSLQAGTVLEYLA